MVRTKRKRSRSFRIVFPITTNRISIRYLQKLNNCTTKQSAIEESAMTKTRKTIFGLAAALLTGCVLPALVTAQAKRLSDKDLFKKATTELAAGKLDDAFTSITSARTQKGKPDKKYDDVFSMV